MGGLGSVPIGVVRQGQTVPVGSSVHIPACRLAGRSGEFPGASSTPGNTGSRLWEPGWAVAPEVPLESAGRPRGS